MYPKSVFVQFGVSLSAQAEAVLTTTPGGDVADSLASSHRAEAEIVHTSLRGFS